MEGKKPTYNSNEVDAIAEQWVNLVIANLTYQKEAKDKTINNHKENYKYERANQ